jgi:hypothetical protein
MSSWGEAPRGRWGKHTVGGALTLARAGYGVALVLAPGALIRLTGRPAPVPGGSGDAAARAEAARGRARGVARVLGARHLAQAGLTAAAQWADPGSPGSFGLGAAVDLVHAASMVGLGAIDRRVRRTTFADAAVETLLAAAGAWTATG